ncbi:MAG: PsbP-related protein [Nitrososphaeraceae archaeon]
MDNSSHNKKLYKSHCTIVAIIILLIALVIAASYFNNFQMSMAQMNMPSSSMNMSAPIDYNSTKFIIYKNSSLGIQVLHPISWKPVEKNTASGQVVEFIPAVENEHQPLMPFVTLSLENMNKKITDLNSLTNQNMQIAKGIPGFHLINSSNTVLSEVPAHKIIYTFTSPIPIPSEFQSMNIWAIKGNSVYTISYSETKSEYLKHIPAIEKMVRSFVIVK